MSARIQLFEFGPTRSARCRWILQEADLPFESIDRGPEAIGSDELKAVHPLGKLPAAIIDGEPLFESTAITTAIADLVPEQGLIGASGTRARALHDQWTSYALAELDAWSWSSAINTFVLPEEERLDNVHEQNRELFRRAAKVLDEFLSDVDYLVDNRFSATDVNVGYAINAGRSRGWLDGFDHLNAYLDRLIARPACPLPA